MIVTILLALAVMVLAALGVLLGLFAIWCIISRKTLRDLQDEGFYD